VIRELKVTKEILEPQDQQEPRALKELLARRARKV
jgi:hypothetical protein